MSVPEIVPARRSDLTDLARLARRLVEAELTPTWTEPRLERVQQSADARILVLRRGRGVVGGAVLQCEGAEAHLALLVVDPEVQRRGLGRQLLEACERLGSEAGCSSLCLEVREGNRSALSFYRRCGYTQTHERPGYYGPAESALCFSRTLP